MPERKERRKETKILWGFGQSALHFKLRNKIRAHSDGSAKLERNFPHRDGDENDEDEPRVDSVWHACR